MEKDLRRELWDDTKSLFIDLAAIQKILGISRSTIYKMVKDNEIPGTQAFKSNDKERYFVDKKKFRDAFNISSPDEPEQ
mgnify:FL=1